MGRIRTRIRKFIEGDQGAGGSTRIYCNQLSDRGGRDPAGAGTLSHHRPGEDYHHANTDGKRERVHTFHKHGF